MVISARIIEGFKVNIKVREDDLDMFPEFHQLTREEKILLDTIDHYNKENKK